MKVQAIFYSNPDGYPPIINSARVLASAGHSLDILCSITDTPPSIDYPPQVIVRRLKTNANNTWWAYLSFIIQTLRLADTATTAFVGHDMHGFLVARLMATRYRRPVLYHCHDFAEDDAGLAVGGRLVKIFEKRYARTADLVIVPDAERAQVISDALHLQRSPVVVANAPLQRTGASTRLQATLDALGFSFSRVVFRQGRIGPGHAIETTVRSLSSWQDATWGFVIMGLANEDYVDYLRNLAKRHGVDERFVILPPVAYDDVASFTTGASIGHALYDPVHVNNRYITTASNKTMEYMAAGLPLLVSDRPGLRALIERYDCGLTADESDPTSIAAAVNTLLGDPLRARQMGANAARAFDEEFRYEKQFAPVLTAMTEMASGRHR